jgi:hypothetical protein
LAQGPLTDAIIAAVTIAQTQLETARMIILFDG